MRRQPMPAHQAANLESHSALIVPEQKVWIKQDGTTLEDRLGCTLERVSSSRGVSGVVQGGFFLR